MIKGVTNSFREQEDGLLEESLSAAERECGAGEDLHVEGVCPASQEWWRGSGAWIEKDKGVSVG
jgi:hypothetical protein